MFEQEHLISVVRAQRLLWDKRHKHYRHRTLTRKAWRNVADTLGCTSDEAQSKWKNLRDSYSRELKKIPKKISGADVDVEYTGDWIHFEAMHFLKGVIKHRKSSTTIRSIKILPEETDHIDEESVMSNSTGLSSSAENQTYLQSELDNFASIQYASNDNTAPTDGLLYPDILLQKDYATSDISNTAESKNIKHSDFGDFAAMYADLERQKFGLVKKEIGFQEDEDINWFKSILPHLRMLPSFKKFSFRTKVQEMLLHELTKLNSSQPESSTDPHLSSASSVNPLQQ